MARVVRQVRPCLVEGHWMVCIGHYAADLAWVRERRIGDPIESRAPNARHRVEQQAKNVAAVRGIPYLPPDGPLSAADFEVLLATLGHLRAWAEALHADHVETLRCVVLLALAAGVPELRVATQTGLDRNKIRRWAGKD